MRLPRPAAPPLLLALAALLASAGCAEAPPPVAEVAGEVTFGGEPVSGGIISFVPLDSARPPGGAAVSDGKYRVSPEVALRPGAYRVEVRWSRPTGEKREAGYGQSPEVFAEALPAKYHADSVLTADLKPGENALDFRLEK